jgi:hypothetical protein
MGYGSPRRLRHIALVAAIASCAPVPAAHAGGLLPAPGSVALPTAAAAVAEVAATVEVAVAAAQSSPSPAPQQTATPPAAPAPSTARLKQLTRPVDEIGPLSPPPVALETRTGGAAAPLPSHGAAGTSQDAVAPAGRPAKKESATWPAAAAPTDARTRSAGLAGRQASLAGQHAAFAGSPLSTAPTTAHASRVVPAPRATSPVPVAPGLVDDAAPFGAGASGSSSSLLVAVALTLLFLVPPLLPGRFSSSRALPRGLLLARLLERPG